MRNTDWRLSACGTAMVAVALAVAPGRTALAAAPLEQFTAFAVDMSNIAGRTRTGTIDILIDRWSTDAERDTLVSALREGGSDGLLRALQKIKKPAGSIRSAGSVGYRLQFARQVTRDDGGRRILIATDRPISFLEAVNQPRTTDYPFMILDIRLNAKQEGEGKLIPLAKIEMNGDHVVEIENYASEPVRLNQVKKLK